MAQHEIDTFWMGKMQFNSAVAGHTIVMDAPERVGGEDAGPIPKPFVLVALSGCTGMDIVALLRKAKLEVDSLNIHVTGELSKQPPIEYISIHLVYEIAADESMKDEVLKMVDVSQNKYCGVSNMLKKALPVTWEIIFNDQVCFSNKPLSGKELENSLKN
jgi:putative redox protein